MRKILQTAAQFPLIPIHPPRRYFRHLSDQCFATGVTPVGPITTGLPDLTGSGYGYRSFSLDGSDGLTGKGFLRAKVSN